MPISRSVRGRISEIATGRPFLIDAFLDLDNRAAIGQALTRLVRAGEIKRVAPAGQWANEHKTEIDGLVRSMQDIGTQIDGMFVNFQKHRAIDVPL